MQSVTLVAESNPGIGCDVIDVDVLVDVDDEFSFGMDFDQNLLLVHRLHHLANVGTLLLEKLELFSQHSYCKNNDQTWFN